MSSKIEDAARIALGRVELGLCVGCGGDVVPEDVPPGTPWMCEPCANAIESATAHTLAKHLVAPTGRLLARLFQTHLAPSPPTEPEPNPDPPGDPDAY